MGRPLPPDGAVVVVGGGHAGVQLAATLRDKGHRGRITLVAGEGRPPYDRPMLSKEFLAGRVDAPAPLRSDHFYADHAIEVLWTSASVIAPAQARVLLVDGSVLDYDHLVLATGGKARSVPVPGGHLSIVMSLRDLRDAGAIRQHLARATRVVVIGAGFIGLEVAAVVRQSGTDVVVVEASERAMGRTVTPTVSRLVEAHHSREGIDFRMGSSVVEVRGDGSRHSVLLDSGEDIGADLVLAGVGMVADDDLARAAGLQTSNGVLVDEWLQTSDLSISAIGDCAVVVGPDGAHQRLESVANAQSQALRLAERLVGLPATEAAVPSFWSHQGDLKLQIAGLPRADYEQVPKEEEGRFSNLGFHRGQLAAVESVNDPGTHMAARRILGAGVTIEECAEANFDLRSLARQRRAPSPDRA